MNQSKINIMFIIDMIAGLHGTEKYLLNFIKLFDKQRFETVIVSLYHKNKVAEEFYDLGIPIISIPIKKIYSPFSFKKYLNLYHIVRRYKIDVLETIHKTSDFIGPIIGRLAGTTIIISNRRDMGFWRTTKDDIAYRIIDRFVGRIKCNTRAASKKFSQLERAPISKFDVCYNGVEIGRYSISEHDKTKIKMKYGIKENEKVVGVLGGVKKLKGHIEFLEMAEMLSQSHYDVKFMIVGGGYKEKADEYFNYIKKLSIEKGLNRKVVFTGFIKEIDKILPIFDIAILPSYTEGCSNVLLEYMAAGKPVVATDVGGNPELVTHGITGFIVPSRDINSLREKTLLLLSSESLRRRMGLAGYEKANDSFSLTRMVSMQMDYYENLMRLKAQPE